MPVVCRSYAGPMALMPPTRVDMNKTCVLISLLMSALLALGASARTTQDGVYSKDQARVGRASYKEHCLVCHDKKYFKPVLRRWSGQSAAILYEVMITSMPESNPGGLADQQYVDILAYIFSLSRYPIGEAALDYRDGALQDLVIED